MCFMNYYNCIVECKNTVLNTTLASNGVIAGTGPFANSCTVTACEAMGDVNVSCGVVTGITPIEVLAAVIVIAVAAILVIWHLYNRPEDPLEK